MILKKSNRVRLFLLLEMVFFGTRGAMEESSANENNYPGTYLAGVYNRLESKVGDRIIENEDFVNCPNWLPFNFKIDNGNWMNINEIEILQINRTLNFKNGLLNRKMIVKDNSGNKTEIESQRIASMENHHLAAIQYSVKPLNYSGKITIRTGINGNLINDGVDRYKQLNQKHLKSFAEGAEKNNAFVVVKTTQSDIEIAEASKINSFLNGNPQNEVDYENIVSDGEAYILTKTEIEKNSSYKIEKIVSIFTSKDRGVKNPLQEAEMLLEKQYSFDIILKTSEINWAELWDEIDIKLEGDRLAQKLLRLHLYHLMLTISPHNKNIDAGIPARGLHGEAYRGHIFWDELFILPFYNIHFKEAAKSVLMYRYRRLDEARKYAKENNYEGAMFPWQSGSYGREETQIVHLNPLTGEWGDDYSCLQRHVSLAIAYNIWQYFQATNDKEFIENYGAEMFFEICRFWAGKAIYNESINRYEVKNVMGPDEFHEKYKNAKQGGLTDNSYTNIMLVWMLSTAFEMIDLLDNKSILFEKLKLSKEELNKWNDITKKINLEISEDGIISQYSGYFDLKELDWDAYREKYGNIYRMDRILKAEGKSADDYKVAKQADTLMTFYNLEKPEVDKILKNLDYTLPENYVEENLKYYLQRTSHGSTLSRVVHAYLANLIGDTELSWKLFHDALTSDYNDIQGGTTGEGIHTGVMAGTILITIMSYAGLNIRSGEIAISPNLPKHWRKISFTFHFKGIKYFCEISGRYVTCKAYTY